MIGTDQALIEANLRLADSHIELGQHHVAQQRESIDKLRHDGHSTAIANSLLLTLENTLAAHVADRDRLRAELAEFESKRP